MTKQVNRRYCLDRQSIAMMQRDGMGWGHDLDAGCVTLETAARDRFSPKKFYRKLRRGV